MAYPIKSKMASEIAENLFEFLIKWQDSELVAPSWEPAENYVDLDIINDHL